MSKTTMVSFPLRAEPELLDQVKTYAQRHNISANRVLVNAINDYLKAEMEREWREGFEAMGRDADTRDVEYMLPAAREVVLGD